MDDDVFSVASTDISLLDTLGSSEKIVQGSIVLDWRSLPDAYVKALPDAPASAKKHVAQLRRQRNDASSLASSLNRADFSHTSASVAANASQARKTPAESISIHKGPKPDDSLKNQSRGHTVQPEPVYQFQNCHFTYGSSLNAKEQSRSTGPDVSTLLPNAAALIRSVAGSVSSRIGDEQKSVNRSRLDETRGGRAGNVERELGASTSKRSSVGQGGPKSDRELDQLLAKLHEYKEAAQNGSFTRFEDSIGRGRGEEDPRAKLSMLSMTDLVSDEENFVDSTRSIPASKLSSSNRRMDDSFKIDSTLGMEHPSVDTSHLHIPFNRSTTGKTRDMEALQTVHSELSDLADRLKMKSAKLSSREKAMSLRETNLNTREESLNAQEKELALLAQQLQDQRIALQERYSSHEGRERDVEDREREIAVRSRELKTAEGKMKEQVERLVKVKCEKEEEDMRKETEALHLRYDEVVGTVSKDNKRLTASLKEMVAVNRHLRDQIQTVQTELAAKSARCEELQRQSKQQRERIDRLKASAVPSQTVQPCRNRNANADDSIHSIVADTQLPRAPVSVHQGVLRQK
ncbi:hypothetical protein HDV00_004074 [Rhizophlyctis rosea]|nr:hypothetical protein HDV00_004074 [Rhizophlyctis rosea]